MEKKIAFFDIDKTIIKKDSMFLFLWYSMKKNPRVILIGPQLLLYTILYKVNLVKAEKAKECYFFGIKFFTETDLKDFYESMLKITIFKDALDELKKKKEQGYYIMLVSASPYAYVKFFEEIPYVDKVIGTELKTFNGRYLNEIKGNNCKGEEKVVRIHSFLKQQQIEIDYNNSYAYSDSLSDLPMFKLVNNKFIINGMGKSGVEEKVWR